MPYMTHKCLNNLKIKLFYVLDSRFEISKLVRTSVKSYLVYEL